MRLKQRLASLLKVEKEEIPKDVTEELKKINLLLFGKRENEIHPGILKSILEQNQKIYWSVNDEESGMSIIKMLKERPPKERKRRLEELKKGIEVEIEEVDEELAEKKILKAIDKHGKLSATDLAIYTSTPKEKVLKIVKRLVLDGKLKSKGEFFSQ